MADKRAIVSCAIYPAIGVARVGNSDDDPFLAPQFPGDVAAPPYKDAQGRIRRQAPLFRVYGLDKKGKVVRELNAGEKGVRIEWTVHLANRKAAWYNFERAMDIDPANTPAQGRRNSGAMGADRAQLVIDPGPRTISGVNQSGQVFDTGAFKGTAVYLGELRTDDVGRLLVLGGKGHSASADGSAAADFANNDGWHDDVSDGPVRARVWLGGKEVGSVKPAFAIVAPPNYGQGLFAVVTMYDLLSDLFDPRPGKVSFWRDIYPIFERLTQCQWVNEGIYFLLGANSPSDLTASPLVDALADPSAKSKAIRRKIFDWFRKPGAGFTQPDKLPPFYGDLSFKDADGATGTASLSVTRKQYAMLRRWAAGKFTNNKADRYVPPASLGSLPIERQPHALDRASLEECVGGPFHPGVEMTWIARRKSMWAEPFRLKVQPANQMVRDDYGVQLTPKTSLGKSGPLQSSGPGTITRWMALPWQADTSSCLAGYTASNYLPLPTFWAVRVPNEVLSKDAYDRIMNPSLPLAQRLKHFDRRQFWLRDDLVDGLYETTDNRRINSMIANWDKRGIVAKQSGPGIPEIPSEVWVETGRDNPGDFTVQQVLIAES